ncbi:hypothetical protein G7Y79_00069g096510 [Physcia stellaris]|nr:hypothetical protein G7Y79_00069g096510 [Physcia stellaris]
MKYGKDAHGEDLDMHNSPVIIVAHSMGGLVAKKAYLLGQNDETYQEIVRSISAIVFLATPHHGSNLAEVLKRLLKISLQPSREFIADLEKGSHTLEDLNEQFRHVAPKLSIWSFYETLATPVGPMNVMVLDKNSSMLGYTKEISRPLNADHHGVCKYSSQDDSNYISVRNALSSIVRTLKPRELAARGKPVATKAVEGVQKILGVFVSPEDDLNSIRRLWLSGTCSWLLYEPQIQLWMETRQESCVTWFSGPPGSGKSILSAYMITHLLNSDVACQYFFFKFDDPGKRSLSAFLRSMAYQVAKDIPDFRRGLMDLVMENTRLEKTDSLLIWKNLFESILLKLNLIKPLYWVVDALDESEVPKALLELLHTITNSHASIRILIFSRKTESLSLAFGRLSRSLTVHLLEKDGTDFNALDIDALIDEEIQNMRGSHELRQRVAQSVRSRAQGSFLWVRLVLEELVSCHTEDAIQGALKDIPDDMNELYRRMEMSILSHPRKMTIDLAKAILQWATCAGRLLTLKELSQALRPEIPELLDLRRTIQDVCGQFTIINDAGQVTVVHQTAREYLTMNSGDESFVNVDEAHAKLFGKSISVLRDPNLRYKCTHSRYTLPTAEPFLIYAATTWTYHLRHITNPSNEVLDTILDFFKSKSVLAWIHALALFGHLDTLVEAAKVLTRLVNHSRKSNSKENPLLHRGADLDVLELWAVDLVKMIGKFSRQISSDPTIIYNLIPALCPKYSIVHQQFHQQDPTEISIKGLSDTHWNDNLAKLVLPNGDQLRKSRVLPLVLLFLEPDPGWQLVEADLLKEASPLHGPHISWPTCIAFNGDVTQVGHVIGLIKAYCVFKWHPVTDEIQEAQLAVDKIASSSDGKTFVTSSCDGTVRVWNFAHFSVIYQLSSADVMIDLAFSPDSMRFYDLRYSSVCAWEPSSLIRLAESEESSSDTAIESQAPTSVSHISEASLNYYNAVTVVAAGPGRHWYCAGNQEGSIFLFNTRTDHTTELLKGSGSHSSNYSIAWSQDGTHIVTAHHCGTIYIMHLTAWLASPGNGSPTLKSLMSPRIDRGSSGVKQFLFNPDSSLLLIASSAGGGHIWSLKNQKTTATLSEDNIDRRWLQHPLQETLILSFGLTHMQVFNWHDFSEQARLPYSRKNDDPAEEHSLAKYGINTVSKAILTQTGEHIMLQIKILTKGIVSSQLFLLPVSSFANNEPSRSLIFIPPAIHAKAEIPLGMLPGSRLAFLDQDLWFCTFNLSSSREYEDRKIKRHYFVPRDWFVNERVVKQCCMMEDGTFLCPKGDKVVVITCDLEVSGL